MKKSCLYGKRILGNATVGNLIQSCNWGLAVFIVVKLFPITALGNPTMQLGKTDSY